MGASIVLDPYDVYRLTTGLQKDFQELAATTVELNVVDGLVLPNLKMLGAAECCSYLNEDGRCSIHGIRPGICRLFPLGRYYEEGSFRYFLQTRECTEVEHTKVKISKWLDTPEIKRYEDFVSRWHYLTMDVGDIIMSSEDENFCRNLNMLMLNTFYLTPYGGNTDFYGQFEERYKKVRGIVTQ